MKTFGSKKLLKLILQVAIGLVLCGLLWIVFSFTRPKYNDDALFSYEIINQSNQNIEELIIGEYSQNDINSPEDRVYLKNLAANSRTKGAVDISKSERSVSPFYLDYVYQGKRKTLLKTVSVETRPKGLHITIKEVDNEGYMTGTSEINSFIFEKREFTPESIKRAEKAIGGK
jgi:hypothetical protein